MSETSGLKLTWTDIIQDIGRFTNAERESFLNRDSELSKSVAEKNVDYSEISKLFDMLKEKHVISTTSSDLNFIDIANASLELGKWTKTADQTLENLSKPIEDLQQKTAQITDRIQYEYNKLQN